MATMESSKSGPGPAQGPSNMSLNATKAGMAGLDTEKINSIISEIGDETDIFSRFDNELLDKSSSLKT